VSFESFVRRTIRTAEHLEHPKDLFFDLPVGERLRAGLDMSDVGIAVRV
jgi:hypothetical protein